jgi:hypothetical protein
VTDTGKVPGAVHVKFVAAELAAVSVPLGADHANARAAGSGDVTDTDKAIEEPTVVSIGLAVT